jgi:hypothetical protein
MTTYIDTEQWLIDYLKAKLVDIPVSTLRLTATTMVRIERTGGVAPIRFTDEPTFAVEAYAPTQSKAVALLNRVRSLIEDLPRQEPSNGTWCYRYTEAGGVVYLPDPLHASPRYTMTVSLHIRSKEIGAP